MTSSIMRRYLRTSSRYAVTMLLGLLMVAPVAVAYGQDQRDIIKRMIGQLKDGDGLVSNPPPLHPLCGA
jgi:hypothetical protein